MSLAYAAQDHIDAFESDNEHATAALSELPELSGTSWEEWRAAVEAAVDSGVGSLVAAAMLLLRKLGASHQELGWPRGAYAPETLARVRLVAERDASVAYLARLGAHLQDPSWLPRRERVAVIAAWLLWGDPDQWPAPEEYREVSGLLLEASGRRELNALWLRGHLREASCTSIAHAL